MTHAILNIVNAGETTTTEFKATFQKEVIETVVAFANAKGGQILIGVTDAMHIKGVVINHETLKDRLNQIKNNTLNSGHYASRTRNRSIANMFKECGLIERYGSGIKRIKNACAQHGISEPVFEEFQHGFSVTIYKKANVEGVNQGVNALLLTIKLHPGLRVPALAKRMQTSAKNIERWLKQLKESGMVEFRGAAKTGGYYYLDADE